MLNIREYVKVQSLEEAYELNQKRTNKVIGGMLWMKMGSRNIQKAIDLSGLGLDKIEETEEEFRIGLHDYPPGPGTASGAGSLHRRRNEGKPPPYRGRTVQESGHGGRKHFRALWVFRCADSVSGA